MIFIIKSYRSICSIFLAYLWGDESMSKPKVSSVALRSMESQSCSFFTHIVELILLLHNQDVNFSILFLATMRLRVIKKNLAVHTEALQIDCKYHRIFVFIFRNTLSSFDAGMPGRGT